MTPDLLAAALVAGSGAAAGLSAPRVIGRLREPPASPPASPPAPPATRPPAPPASLPRATLEEVAATPRLAPMLAAVGAVLGAVVGWGVGWTPMLAAWAYLTALCVVLGYVDARTRLLPTQLIAPSYAVIGVLVGAAGLADGSLGLLERALLGWLVMGGFYFLMWQLAPGSLGYGDVRLSGLLALCLGPLGWSQLVTGLYAGFLLGGITSGALVLARRASRKTHIPFGPFMMLGAVVGVVLGSSLGRWYALR